MRALLVGLIVLATIGFVIGTTIERHNASHESAAQQRSEGTGETGGEKSSTHAEQGGGESPPSHAGEGGGTVVEQHKELRPLGVDIEAVPFVVLAALASLALAWLGWARPRWLAGLAVIAAAMVVFGALDAREAFHQSDEDQTGLVILAIAIAVLHFGAAAAAAAMAARREGAGPARAGTIPA